MCSEIIQPPLNHRYVAARFEQSHPIVIIIGYNTHVPIAETCTTHVPITETCHPLYKSKTAKFFCLVHPSWPSNKLFQKTPAQSHFPP